ncbi:hypothetical protein G5714_014464 [Onychostoma macrolepis]|uniref:Uncharacterized protein n=1 Tax=Onychostoma macrolepis TaxID=369639 RepID=A0A7J6CEU3_9TELE|nr:hypothetical protein G5714_014464 [Onychostoma macrolepis]
MKASVCFVFAVVCWIAAQAEESPKILTLSKVMNELNKINQGMFQGETLRAMCSCCDDFTLMECFRCGLDPCWTLEKFINFALWVDGELTLAVMNEPETEKWTEPRISPGHELHCEFDQVCEPVLISVAVVVLVELNTDERLIDWEKEVVLPTLPATIGSSLQHCSYPSSSSGAPALPPQSANTPHIIFSSTHSDREDADGTT